MKVRALHVYLPALTAFGLLVPVMTGSAAGAPSAARATSGYVWPLAPPHPVARPFHPPPTPYGRGHRGVDLGAATASPVRAANAGTVVFAGELAGRGVVSIEHSDGLRTTYEPMSATVHRGDRVRPGQPLGLLRAGHDCRSQRFKVCLHWGARRGKLEYIDPLGLLAGGRVRLLPWREP
jgi:murein DD-endopeptidase MepM/ murein hydrolase activator NlpD